MTERINFLFAVVIILIVGFLSILLIFQKNNQASQLFVETNYSKLVNTSIKPELSCTTDNDCLRSSVGDDPNLQQYKYSGDMKNQPHGWRNRKRIDIACISKKYYEENIAKYNLTDQVYYAGESICSCVENQCKEVRYGAPPKN